MIHENSEDGVFIIFLYFYVLAAYQAICEFIDNGIQATNSNKIDRKITIYIFATQVSSANQLLCKTHKQLFGCFES